MMLKTLLLLSLSFLSIFSFGQKVNAFDAHQVNEDLSYLQEVLYTSHPNVFRYISRDSIDGLFETLNVGNNDTTSSLILEQKVRVVLSELGCIHTSVKGSVFKYNKAKAIPFSIYAKGDSMWVKADLSVDTSFRYEGSRILSINGHESKVILNKMKNYHASDGFNSSFKYALINEEGWFGKLYKYYFDSDTIKTYQILTNNFDTLIIKKENGSVKPRVESSHQGLKMYGKNISVRLDTINNIAILKIKSFAGAPVFWRQINKNRYKRAIKYINKQGYEKLVIDLRGNTGGDGASGNALLSFFVSEKYSFLVRKHKGGIWKHAVLSSRVGIVLNSFLGHLFAHRQPTFKNRASLAKIKVSKRNRFDGQVFVITDGFTGSTASNTAAVFKYKTDAILVGTETGGSEDIVNAYLNSTIKLPHSKIRVRIPQYQIDLNLGQKNGTGVTPHIKVEYNIQDIISGEDLEMTKIIDLLKQ